VPVFLPVRAPKQDLTAIQALRLDSSHEGDLRWILAQNKGITVVTTAGASNSKQTLLEAVNSLDPDLGWHCHRSLWVAKAEVVKIVYIKGNPQLEVHGGQRFPISRGAVGPIRDHLRQPIGTPVLGE
jgi:DNA-binding LytR/AlgR family response regulator